MGSNGNPTGTWAWVCSSTTHTLQTHEFLKPALKSSFLINMSHNIINWIYSNWNKLHITNFKLKLVITCSFYPSLLMYWLLFTWWIIFYVDVSWYGKPVGYLKLSWVWFGQNFIPVMGMSFLADIFFLCGYGFGQVIPNGFLPVAISSHRCYLLKASPPIPYVFRVLLDSRFYTIKLKYQIRLGINSISIHFWVKIN
jgi:hypothetical protein